MGGGFVTYLAPLRRNTTSPYHRMGRQSDLRARVGVVTLCRFGSCFAFSRTVGFSMCYRAHSNFQTPTRRTPFTRLANFQGNTWHDVRGYSGPDQYHMLSSCCPHSYVTIRSHLGNVPVKILSSDDPRMSTHARVARRASRSCEFRRQEV